MTKQEIIAELRRSACEDADPWRTIRHHAFRAACHWNTGLFIGGLEFDDCRTFFLLVAAAMEGNSYAG